MKYKRGALGHFSRCPCNYGLGVPTAGSAVSRQSSGTASGLLHPKAALVDRQTGKSWGPQSYSYEEINSYQSLKELGKIHILFSFSVLQIETQPNSMFTSCSLMGPEQRNQLHHALTPDLQKPYDNEYFKLPNL